MLEVREAIIALYLDVKVRSNDEVCLLVFMSSNFLPYYIVSSIRRYKTGRRETKALRNRY
jgi:hypothetical protein